MKEFGIFLLYWLFLMVLIGGALLLTQKFRKKGDGEEETVDPKDYEIVSPYDPKKKEKLEKLEQKQKEQKNKKDV